MIGRLEGLVLEREEQQLLLDVNGVGFLLFVPASLKLAIGQQAVFFTALIVRENELSLYGFPDREQLRLFQLLLGVSGVGPKAALSLVGTLTPDELRDAVIHQRAEVIARAPGIGRKTAEAIILHLKNRLDKLGGAPLGSVSSEDADLLAALTALGFSLIEAQRALQQLPRSPELTLEEKLRQALALLSR